MIRKNVFNRFIKFKLKKKRKLLKKWVAEKWRLSVDPPLNYFVMQTIRKGSLGFCGSIFLLFVDEFFAGYD